MEITENPALASEEAVFRARISMVRSLPTNVRILEVFASGQVGVIGI